MALQIPKIGFGTYNISRSKTAGCVVNALEVGYRLIDTAALYNNEQETMQGIRDFLKLHPEVSRDEIIYTSKIWDSSFGKSLTPTAVDDSLAKAIEPIDLYLMHSSGDGPSEREETWKILEKYVQQGKIKHIGVSNWGIKHIKELEKYASIKPVVNQIEVNPWKRMDDLVAYCQSKDIVVECYSPLTLGKTLRDPELVELGKKYNKSPAQIQLRYLVQRDIVPLPKSSSKDRMIENFEIFDFELTNSEMAELGDAKKYIMAIPGWDPTTWS